MIKHYYIYIALVLMVFGVIIGVSSDSPDRVIIGATLCWTSLPFFWMARNRGHWFANQDHASNRELLAALVSLEAQLKERIDTIDQAVRPDNDYQLGVIMGARSAFREVVDLLSSVRSTYRRARLNALKEDGYGSEPKP